MPCFAVVGVCFHLGFPLSSIQIQVTCKSKSAEGVALKEMLHKIGVPVVREQLASYIRELKEGVFVCMCLCVCVSVCVSVCV